MNEEKIREILTAMQGITYHDWKKLSQTITERFRCEVTNQSNKILIASPDEIVMDFKRDFN